MAFVVDFKQTSLLSQKAWLIFSSIHPKKVNKAELPYVNKHLQKLLSTKNLGQ
jgi:hypothetical protein